jgi:hypothetical protein
MTMSGCVAHTLPTLLDYHVWLHVSLFCDGAWKTWLDAQILPPPSYASDKLHRKLWEEIMLPKALAFLSVSPCLIGMLMVDG